MVKKKVIYRNLTCLKKCNINIYFNKIHINIIIF